MSTPDTILYMMLLPASAVAWAYTLTLQAMYGLFAPQKAMNALIGIGGVIAVLEFAYVYSRILI